jgi:hypothetical protein
MLTRFLRPAQPPVPAPAGARGPAATLAAGHVRYPPRDPGLPVQAPAAIVGAQPELMAMLRLHAAVEPALFDSRFCEPVERVAAHVNVLPGSASAAFGGAGGLFRAALETAVACFRASDGRIFTGALGVEARHQLEPRWRYLCFLAGLLFPLGRSPELDALTPWAARHGATRLFLSWTGPADLGPGAVTGTFALLVVGRDNIEWMNRGSPALLRALLHIVTGRLPKGLVAASLVSEVWTAVQAREASRCQGNWRRVTIGTQIAPYLLDAMVALSRSDWLQQGNTTLQADGSGLSLVWPQAGRDIIAFCRRQGTPGIPLTEPAVLALLVDGGLVEPGVEGTGLSMDKEGEHAGRMVVRVAQPELLLDAAGGATTSLSIMDPPLVPSPDTSDKQDSQESVDGSASSEPGADPAEQVATTAGVSAPAQGLPPDLVLGLSSAHAHILATLVARWREGLHGAVGMHRCQHGAAFELRLLAELGTDPTSFLTRVAELGLLYAAPSTAGRLVYALPRGEEAGGGRPGPGCFILTPAAMVRLGLS